MTYFAFEIKTVLYPKLYIRPIEFSHQNQHLKRVGGLTGARGLNVIEIAFRTSVSFGCHFETGAKLLADHTVSQYFLQYKTQMFIRLWS